MPGLPLRRQQILPCAARPHPVLTAAPPTPGSGRSRKDLRHFLQQVPGGPLAQVCALEQSSLTFCWGVHTQPCTRPAFFLLWAPTGPSQAAPLFASRGVMFYYYLPAVPAPWLPPDPAGSRGDHDAWLLVARHHHLACPASSSHHPTVTSQPARDCQDTPH